MEKIIIYTDGACSGNPGIGGYGAILISGQYYKEISGKILKTTNNQMELTAVIKAVECVKIPSNIVIYSDSAYVVNAFNQGWINNWEKNSWRTSNKKPVQNKELWLSLLSLLNKHTFNFVKVKGHADNKYNNRCDELATEAIRS